MLSFRYEMNKQTKKTFPVIQKLWELISGDLHCRKYSRGLFDLEQRTKCNKIMYTPYSMNTPDETTTL